MAFPDWIGGAPAVAQVNTITIANVAATNTFSITIGNAVIAVTAGGGDTPTSIAAALVTLATNATAPPQFSVATWANVAGVITMTQIASLAGMPIIQISGATGGTASATTATTTASSGPNWWSVAANWLTNTVPVNGDTVTITGAGADILYGIDQNAITGITLIVNSKTISIGLPPINVTAPGGNYPEYLPQYLKIQCSTLNVLQASGRCKINGHTGAMAASVLNSQTGTDSAAGIPAVLILNTNVASTLYQLGGDLGVAFYGGETSQFASVITSGGTLTTGSGLTVATLESAGGAITAYGNATTVLLDPDAGEVDLLGGTGAAYTTIKVFGGTLNYQAGGTIGTLLVGLTGTVDFTKNLQARTITNCTLSAGATLTDTSRTVTFTNPFSTSGCRLSDVKLDFGAGHSYQISA